MSSPNFSKTKRSLDRDYMRILEILAEDGLDKRKENDLIRKDLLLDSQDETEVKKK